MKKTIAVLFVAFINIYSVPKINPVSPYINKGISLHFQASYNPLKIEYTYKKEALGNQYAAYAGDIYLTQRNISDDIYVSIGNKNEKNEVLVTATSSIPITLKIYFRSNNKILDVGENNLFQNIAVSYFLGFSFVFYPYSSMFDDFNFSQDNGFGQLYSGAAIGTRKKIIDDFSYIEIFTAPQISLTYYGGLGGGDDFNPVIEIEPSWSNNFSVTMYDFYIPIGVGFKHKLFFIKSGIAISTTFNGETRKISGGNLIVDSYNFPQIPFFAEIGFHFRKFKSLEKELKNKKEI
ncbi:MAG: hypothetical protein FWF51_10935 [Chitinivibrionia bacterium]|nr:hypothetical protein [Chitinivibrionia bacterium]